MEKYHCKNVIRALNKCVSQLVERIRYESDLSAHPPRRNIVTLETIFLEEFLCFAHRHEVGLL